MRRHGVDLAGAEFEAAERGRDPLDRQRHVRRSRAAERDAARPRTT